MKRITNKEFTERINRLKDAKDYQFLENYQGTHTKIKIKHLVCGHEFFSSPHNFLTGRRCPFCSNKSRSLNRRLKNDDFLKKVKLLDSNYIPLEPYISSHTKIKFKHLTCGTEFLMKPNNFLNGQRCPSCMEFIRRKKKRKTHETFVKEIKEKYKDEYTVLGTYKTKETKILVKHNICNSTWEITPHNLLAGHQCPQCAKTFSASEKEVLKFLQEFYPNKIDENRKFNNKNGKRFELDIYIPALKIGIEFDGLYWHSDTKVGKRYHLDKTLFFKNKDIRVIHIFEDEWKYKQDIVKSKLRHILGYSNTEKIYARKCTIQTVPSKDRAIFLNRYHIQGTDNGSIREGLYYNGELVSIMTFGKQRISLGIKKTTTGDFELIRFASSKNVVGAFSKLLEHCIKKFNIKHIKTFADLRYSSFDSNVYSTNGFVLSHISDPSYWYFRNNQIERFHRFIFRKHEVERKFPTNFDKKLTEYENMKNNGYDRIWDCGNLVFVKDII